MPPPESGVCVCMMSTTCRINSSPFKMAIFVIRRRVFSLATLRHSTVSTAAAAAAAAAAAVPTRNFSFRLFDRLIPEDDPETKARKEKEKAIVHSKLHRSKFAEMLSAPKEKLIFATGEVVAPGDAFAPCPAVTVRDGTPLVLTDVFVRAPVTLVTLAFQALGQEQLEPWIDTFVATFDAQREEAARESNGKSSLPQLLNMVYVEGWLFRALAPIVSRSIRNALPPTLVDRTAVVFQTSEKTTDVSSFPLAIAFCCEGTAEAFHSGGARVYYTTNYYGSNNYGR